MGAAFTVTTAMLWGMEARVVRVEVSLSSGLPGICIVGRPDASVSEARSRVRCAIRGTGFEVPRSNVTVNLAPAELRKTGTAFDLPIAVSILAATNQIPTAGLDGCLIVGELSLEGDVCPVRGLIAYADLARRMGLRLIAPYGELNGCMCDADIRFVRSLGEFFEPVAMVGEAPTSDIGASGPVPTDDRDFSEIAGQEVAKRALAVAVTGHLGILLVGPPGVGKTMLASCVPGILPDMTERERFEAALVHSVAGSSDARVAAGLRPFRAPHHSTSVAGLLGGGHPVRPGEVSLAHRGVLFLDELGEYNRLSLQSMRQPMEEGVVRVTRVEGTYEFPCDFQLVAASNPCPCGHLGDPLVPCTCSPSAVATYRSKLAGPLVDRIDIVVALERPRVAEIMGKTAGTSTAVLKDLVMRGREFAAWRRSKVSDVCSGMDVRDETSPEDGGEPGDVGRVAGALRENAVADESRRLLEGIIERQALSVRAIVSTVRIARAVADIEESESVLADHILEAVGYRDREVVA